MNARWASLVAIYSGLVFADQPLQVERWSLPGVASPMWESHSALDPKTGDLWLVRSDKKFSGWRIYAAHCKAGQWSTPQPTAIAGDGLEADPWFTADGQTLWFISTRATGQMKSSALDIWRAQRDASDSGRYPNDCRRR